MSQLAWQTGHLALFTRYGGVPLWVRIDNLKTAVGSGAGPTAMLTLAFRTFARTCGFTVDACRAATPTDKGKVERAVESTRSAVADLLSQPWTSLDMLQGALDARATELHARRRCPITGTPVVEAWRAEQRLLQPVPSLHEPFDCVVARRVTRDCLVAFEGRRYSVPFAWVGRRIEVRGVSRHLEFPTLRHLKSPPLPPEEVGMEIQEGQAVVGSIGPVAVEPVPRVEARDGSRDPRPLGARRVREASGAEVRRGPQDGPRLGAWGEVFGDTVIASAILDRLLHHATTINIKGESYRLKEKRRAGLLRPAPTAETTE